ncbi:MAG: SRPBCC family protein, partial [Xanthomonadales bacterium]|nr:SRPBCC family protein [Xanthomonadales bacterium]
FSGTYECSGTVSTMTNRFEETGPGRTRWIAESEYEFGSVWMKLMAMLMPGAFKKQTRKYMHNFKMFAEANPG